MFKKCETIQEEIQDCGAACLSSIIKYYGGYVPMEKIRRDALIKSNGITAYDLLKAAKQYGFDGYGINTSYDKLFELKEPFIVHMKYKNGLTHYLVVYKVKKDNLLIMDPSIGMKKIKKEEFLESWSNIVIIMLPKNEIVKMNKSSSLFDLFWQIFNSLRYEILRIVSISILLNILVIFSSFYAKCIINGLNLIEYKAAYYLIIIFLSIYLFKNIFLALKNYYIKYLNKELNLRLVLPFIYHILKLPLGILSTKTSGELAKRISEFYNIKELFSELFICLVTDGIEFMFAFFILFNINFKISLIIFVFLSIYIFVNLLFIKPINNKIMDNIIKDTNFNSMITENMNTISTLKNLNAYEYIETKIKNNFLESLDSEFNLTKIVNRLLFIKSLIIDMMYFLTITYGAFQVYNSKIDILDLFTYLMVLDYLSSSFQNVFSMLPKYYYLKKSFTKISEFIDIKEEEQSTNDLKINKGNIVIKNLSYSYKNKIMPLINLNLNIKNNSFVLLKGKSGCGKSTLCKLIYRLYDYEKGDIEIDNHSIKHYNLDYYRNNVIYVGQDDKLFNASLIENLTLNKDIDYKKISNALKVCCLDEFVNQLPFNLQTLILSDASNISGGQKQKIILCRAILRDSKIIILDEALSQVDYKTEVKIINNLKEFLKERTIIYVSHKNVEKELLFDRIIRF